MEGTRRSFTLIVFENDLQAGVHYCSALEDDEGQESERLMRVGFIKALLLRMLEASRADRAGAR